MNSNTWKRTSSLLVFIFLFGSSEQQEAQPKRVGRRPLSGPSNVPIGTTPPNLAGGTIANDAPPGPFFQDFKPPFPTDYWWSGFTVKNQDSVIAGPFPFQTATTTTGLMFGMSDTRRFDGTSIHVDTQRDWVIGINGLPNDLIHRKATSWDTQTVCIQYFNDAQATMDTCLVPGSPYMTFSFQNAQLVLTSGQGNIQSFQWLTGQKGKVTNAGGTYIIYVTAGNLQLTQNGTTNLISQGSFTGTVRLAKLKETSQEAVLDAHASAIPNGVDIAFQVNADVSTQTWNWTLASGNAADLLILAWPHHRRVLQNPTYVDLKYSTLKGKMVGVKGNVWVQRHELPTISWFSLNDPHPSCVSELRKTLEAEVKALNVLVPGDFYFWGGSFAKVSRMALIAEHMGGDGSQELIQKVVDVLKQSIGYWFQARSPSAAFETGWGGLINKDGWNNSWVDFGNGYYNDHHFHYGYLLHGAAVIGKYDQAWLAEHYHFLTHVARDIGNPSPSDPHYVVTRHMDFFAGHSWASGIANGAGPRDQESTSEAINGYYGLLLFATVTNNQPLIDYSRLLLAIEIAGAREYWHLYPNTNDPLNPYPEQGFRNLTTVGNVMDTQAGAWLFWGSQKTQIAAIQILPLTPIGYYTYDKEWIEGAFEYCKGELDDPQIGDAFKSVIYAAYAKVSPQKAYNYSSNLFDWGSGNSASNQLYFVSTQRSDSGGDICSSGLQTPEGLYRIQDIATGQYVTVGGNGQLAATTSVDALAEKFKLGFIPGGGTIKSTSTSKYVTADPQGQSALAAARDAAQAWEIFRWKKEPDGSYILTAMVNRSNVSTQTTGILVNNANDTNGIPASKYKLIPTGDEALVQIPTEGVLQSKQNNLYVVATAANPNLKSIGNRVGDGTKWSFAIVPGTPDTSHQYTIQSQVTNQYVTGNPQGSAPLEAARTVAQGWEYFRILPYEGSYLVIHLASGNPVRLQSDNTLMSNGTSVDSYAVWDIIK